MTIQNLCEIEGRTITRVSPILFFDNKKYMENARGDLIPLAMVPDAKIMEDDTVRNMLAYAIDLNAQLRRFLKHCMDDIGAYQVLLEEKYDAKLGGPKGNMTLTSFDGCMKVSVNVANLLRFGPELVVAKKIVMECMDDWTGEMRDEALAIISIAFNQDRDGQFNRTEIFKLLQLKITDERWVRAMDAIRDAIFIIGTKSYVRFHMRDDPKGKWNVISIDLAKAGA
ncbi:MAG: sulfate transporter [Hyphomicrobiales bacterium]|nr:MAG: sulfate transporter [Hyphomicrobiales bacterium]